MGVSTHVKGFHPPDEVWRKHKKIWDACEDAGVSIPAETMDFFDHRQPDEAGVEIDLQQLDCCVRWGDSYRDGFEIDITALPKNITKIRFYNAC